MPEQKVTDSSIVASHLTHSLVMDATSHPVSLPLGTLAIEHEAFSGTFSGPPPVASGATLPLLIPALLGAAVLAFLSVDTLFPGRGER